jgi:hypothetical protein
LEAAFEPARGIWLERPRHPAEDRPQRNARSEAPLDLALAHALQHKAQELSSEVSHHPNDAGTLTKVTEPLIELRARLEEAAARLRSDQLEPDEVLTLIEDCTRLAAEASAQVEERARAALEPLPDLPGQLPLAAG